MDTGAALLAAILDEPDSDVHRLVYADWLDDAGHVGWAALIRAQCALQRLLLASPDPFADSGAVRCTTLTPEVRLQVVACLGSLGTDSTPEAAERADDLGH